MTLDLRTTIRISADVSSPQECGQSGRLSSRWPKLRLQYEIASDGLLEATARTGVPRMTATALRRSSLTRLTLTVLHIHGIDSNTWYWLQSATPATCHSRIPCRVPLIEYFVTRPSIANRDGRPAIPTSSVGPVCESSRDFVFGDIIGWSLVRNINRDAHYPAPINGPRFLGVPSLSY